MDNQKLFDKIKKEEYEKYKASVCDKFSHVKKSDVLKILNHLEKNPFNDDKANKRFVETRRKQFLEEFDFDNLTPRSYMYLPANEIGSTWYEDLWKKKNDLEKSYTDKGLHFGGYYPDTNQHALEIMFYQNKPFGDQLGIFEFLGYIKPLKDGFKYIKIFEHTLSEYGIYSIKFKDKEYSLTKTTYGRESVIQTFDNMMDCLKYVYDNHPYQESNSQKDED